jgi:hypothetical protein
MAMLRRSLKHVDKVPGLETHLDADTLAAFVEHSHLPGEEAAMFAHLADCETCRKYLAAHAELKEFRWNPSEARRPGSVQPVFFSSLLRAAAGCAAVAAVLWLLFSWETSRPNIMVATSREAPNTAYVASLIERRPISDEGAKTLTKKSGRRSPGAPGPSMRPTFISSYPAREPRNFGASWRNASLQKVAIDDLLAARNSHRFLKEVTLATISFAAAGTFADTSGEAPGVNQIVLKTPFGERRITLEGFWKVPPGRRE